MNSWTILNRRKYERENLRPLFEFVMPFFIEVFGEEIMSAEPCIIYNNPSDDTPMIEIGENPIRIRTNAQSLKHWSQYLYQLSHELTHFAIRLAKTDKNAIIKWFEETVCEAVSMYMLRRAADEWDKCALSALDCQYAACINRYLNSIYNDICNQSALQQCKTQSELMVVEKECEDNRKGHSIERNYLYNEFLKMPDQLRYLIYYPLYMRGDLQIDFDAWGNSVGAEKLVDRLRSIQPKLHTA